MTAVIQMIDENTFTLNARGCEMTLRRVADGWEMYTVNAIVKAFNRGHAIPKFFASLPEVETKYKTWVGVTALIA